MSSVRTQRTTIEIKWDIVGEKMIKDVLLNVTITWKQYLYYERYWLKEISGGLDLIIIKYRFAQCLYDWRIKILKIIVPFGRDQNIIFKNLRFFAKVIC